MVLDIIGGFFLVLTSVMGWYALKGSMDIAWLVCLAVILFLNAIFDAFILIARAVNTQYPLFGKQLSTERNVVHAVLFIGPVAEMISGCLCWCIYREHLNNILQQEGLLDDDGEFGGQNQFGQVQGFGGPQPFGGAGQGIGGGGEYPSQRISQQSGSGSRMSERFQAFQGEGRRLGD